MALEGNLEEFNIVAVLQTIATGRMSGTLTVRESINKASVSFVEGQIIHAESTLQADRIGEILVRTRRISRTQLEKATSAQMRQEQGKRLGQILLEQNLLAPDDLAMAIQVQILETMSRLMLWSRGRWQFQFEPPDSTGTIPAGAMSVEEILSGQIMLLDDLEPLLTKSEILDTVYSIVPGRNKESDRIILEGDEWMVLSAVDGRSTVRQIAKKVGLEADETCQIVADLVAVRLIAPAEVATPPNGIPLLANLPEEPEPPPPPGPARTPAGATVVVQADHRARIEQVLGVLRARTEGREICLIDSGGSLIARQGGEIHSSYPTLFALTAGIFASWQELGRALGESKASTLLYQGAGLNLCLTPVGTQAILMTLYQQTSNSGLVNFWSREASARIARLLAAGQSPPVPLPSEGAEARNGTGASSPAPNLSGAMRSEIARQMDDLFHS